MPSSSQPSEPSALSETLPSQTEAGQADRSERIGRYRLLRVLGEGGMGIVHAAFDDELSRPVAIKLVRGRASSETAARMRREAQAMAQLSHANVVQIYESCDGVR